MDDDTANSASGPAGKRWECGRPAGRHSTPGWPAPIITGTTSDPAAPSHEEVPTLHWPTFDAQSTPLAGVVQPNPHPAAGTDTTTVDTRNDMTDGAAPLGRYRYDLATNSWWWSDELYRIYGFRPGAVIPTGELLLTHTHPEDVEPAAAQISTAIAHGGQYSLRHRIIDTGNQVHTVVSIGEALTDTTGMVTGLAGFVSDLTHSEQVTVTNAVSQAVAEFLARRTMIEQAKGALQGRFRCDADEAFSMLKWRSQHTNTKVCDVADQLLNSLSQPGIDPGAAVFDGFQAPHRIIRSTRTFANVPPG